MNSKQTNRLASYTGIHSVLKAQPGIANVTGLPEAFAMLSDKLDEINRLAKKQTQPVQLRTSERDLILAAMTETTLEIAGYVRTVANREKLPLLLQSVQVGIGSFRRARRAHRVWFAQRVFEAAQSVLPQLAACGVTADTLATFQERIQEATERVNLPRETVGEKRAATVKLAELFAQVEALVEHEIDPLVVPLRKSDTEFSAAYAAARLVVDRPGTHQPTEAEAAAPVPAVIVSGTVTPHPAAQPRAA